MKKDLMTGYKILFKEDSTYEFKFKVLETMINLFNKGCHSLALVAEINSAFVEIDFEKKTAKFIYLGF